MHLIVDDARLGWSVGFYGTLELVGNSDASP